MRPGRYETVSPYIPAGVPEMTYDNLLLLFDDGQLTVSVAPGVEVAWSGSVMDVTLNGWVLGTFGALSCLRVPAMTGCPDPPVTDQPACADWIRRIVWDNGMWCLWQEWGGLPVWLRPAPDSIEARWLANVSPPQPGLPWPPPSAPHWPPP